MEIKIIVVSLKNSHRRDVIKKRLNHQGINEFIFFDAFDARNKSLEELDKLFDIEGFRGRYQRLPAKGEIGCTLSHLKIFEIIVKSNCDKWIVLEDDAYFLRGFNYLLKKDNFPIDCISLIGHSKTSYLKSKLIYFKYPLYNIKKYSGYIIGTNKSMSFRGTVGYTITKDLAFKLLSKVEKNYLADDFNYLGRFVPVKTTKPLLVLEDFRKMESSISKERQDSMKNEKR